MLKKKGRANPFEYLRINPESKKQDIIEAGKELAFDASPEEKTRIRQSVLELTTHPLKHLEYQIFTYYNPEYNDKYWDKSKKEFLRSLINLIRKQDLEYEPEYCLLNNLYLNFTKHPLFVELKQLINKRDKNLFIEVWNDFLQDNIDNYWLNHTLALLHREWAEEFEEIKNKKLSQFHWEEALKYWFKLYPQEEFWNYFRENNQEINKQQFISFIDNFPKMLLDIHRIRFQDYLQEGNKVFAQLHFNCLKFAQREKNGNVKSKASEIIENITSKFLQEAREKLSNGQLSEGIRENYESAINHIKILLELDPENKRALMFVVEKYNNWGFDLYVIDDKIGMVKIAEQSKPYAKKLASQITKGQGFLRENQIVAENLLIQGYICADIKKSTALFKESLEYNPDYENAKKLLEESLVQLQYYDAFKRANEAWQNGNDDEVIRCLKTIPSSFINNEVKKFLAAAYNRRGVNKINSIMNIEPSQLLMSLLRNKSSITSILEEAEEAIDDLENALQYDPYNQQIKNNLNSAKENLKAIVAISKQFLSYDIDKPSTIADRIKNFFKAIFTRWWFWFIFFIFVVALGKSCYN